MTSVGTALEDEIHNIQQILTLVPFNGEQPRDFFLNIYRLDAEAVTRLRELLAKFPVDPAKLLKLGISLGSLVKTLELDEELYALQQQQKTSYIGSFNQFNKNKPLPVPGSGATGVGGSKKLHNGSDDHSDLGRNSTMRVILSNSTVSLGGNQPQPSHHIKFVKNLLKVLKNFDIGAAKELTLLLLSHTINQMHTGLQGLMSQQLSIAPNALPIKLTLKQLLIEKLEINIDLDTMFIYKILFKLTLQILHILSASLVALNMGDFSQGITVRPVSEALTGSFTFITLLISALELDENLLIFSTNSSTLSDLNIPTEEFLRLIKQILLRVSAGLTEPFVKLVFAELAEQDIQSQFNKLLNSL